MKINSVIILILVFTVTQVFAREPNRVEIKLLNIMFDIEKQISKRGLTIVDIHPSDLSKKYSDQEFVRDCWVIDNSKNVVLKLFIYKTRFKNDEFIEKKVIKNKRVFRINSYLYSIGIISEVKQLIKIANDVINTVSFENQKYE